MMKNWKRNLTFAAVLGVSIVSIALTIVLNATPHFYAGRMMLRPADSANANKLARNAPNAVGSVYVTKKDAITPEVPVLFFFGAGLLGSAMLLRWVWKAPVRPGPLRDRKPSPNKGRDAM